LAAIAVVFIGVSKAGFGGGLGMLTTPLCVVAFGARDAIGILLPLLCAGDFFSLYHYWGKWRRRTLLLLLPGVIAGVMLGVWMVGRFSSRQMNVAIGVLAVTFVVFQWVKDWLFRLEGAFQPGHAISFPFGLGAGVTSTFAHGAGPVVALFLIPQKLVKETYVATNVLIFTWINLIKLPFFLGTGLIHGATVRASVAFLPLVPLGVWLGVWLNRRVSEILFLKVVYGVTLLTGVHLIVGVDLAAWLR